MLKYLSAFILLFVTSLAVGIEKTTIDKSLETALVGKNAYLLVDETNSLSFENVRSAGAFQKLDKDIASLQNAGATYWLRFTVSNHDNDGKLFVEFVQPFLDEIDFYYPVSEGNYNAYKGGMKYPFDKRQYHQSTNFLYDLNVSAGEEKTYYARIKIKQQTVLPVRILPAAKFYSNTINLNIWFGIYCGIIIVMFLYNIFVYLSIRDRSYIYYVIHTIVVGLTQATLTGFTYKYLWPDSPRFADFSFFLFTCLVSIVGVQFLIEFLRIRTIAPRIFRVLKIFQAVYVVYIITSLAGFNSITYNAMLPTQGTIAFVILGVSIHLYRRGLSEAKYYLIGWSSLMVAIIIYALKDAGVMPFNNITSYILLFGSAAEVTLLSFALADKINIFKREKEESQAQALTALEENARIIREQNVILETKVTERTVELKQSNDELNKTLKDLKEAEAQLVESEKMASLGQLTAGIAHEINNPINFVTSNVKPLKRDVDMIIDMLKRVEEISLSEVSSDEKKQQIKELKDDLDYDYLKEEISYLLNGITEGSNRTAEIVKGLRVFSRLDEDDLKLADMNEGIDSTLVIVRNTLGTNIDIAKEYGNLPPIECYPGKLNQVFLNIITNGLQAIRSKFKDEKGGLLIIRTSVIDEDHISISIKDNGIGMDENTKKKVFEPFFTTKDVGEGTGLGMSIVYNTINKHNGKIEFESVLGEGTEFIITLPVKLVNVLIEDQVGQQ
jgi:signal transduction histidine kinase